VDWFYIGYCTVMAMFAVAAAYAAGFGLCALRRLPRSLMVGFAVAEDEQCAAEYESAADATWWKFFDRIDRIGGDW